MHHGSYRYVTATFPAILTLHILEDTAAAWPSTLKTYTNHSPKFMPAMPSTGHLEPITWYHYDLLRGRHSVPMTVCKLLRNRLLCSYVLHFQGNSDFRYSSLLLHTTNQSALNSCDLVFNTCLSWLCHHPLSSLRRKKLQEIGMTMGKI
jgi:hypothetical protein